MQLVENRIRYIAIVASVGMPVCKSKIIPTPSLIPKPLGVIGMIVIINVMAVIIIALYRPKL